jgi:hypothetical protein
MLAIAYHLAHYFSLLAIAGQFIIPLASDPFGYGWDLLGTTLYRIDIGLVDARFIWYLAVAAIVIGHIIAVWIGHVTAYTVFHEAALTERACTRSASAARACHFVASSMNKAFNSAVPAVTASSAQRAPLPRHWFESPGLTRPYWRI